MVRRIFLQAVLTGAAYATLAGAGLLKPQTVLARWPSDVFHAQTLDAALYALTGGAVITASDGVVLKMAEQAQDGRTVPLEVISRLPDTRSIALLSEQNPFPALSRFELTAAVAPALSTRIKVGGSGRIIALVEAGGRYYSTTHRIEVSTGGC